MDWQNERYVRLYTRETPDQAAWCWQALALWPWLIARADRAGVLDTRKGPRGLAALTRLPIDVVELGLADLLADGCLRQVETGYLIPNYIDAQSTPASSTQRSAEHRARKRLESRSECNEAQRDATRCNAMQRNATPSRSEPSRTEPRESTPPAPLTGGSATGGPTNSESGMAGAKSTPDETTAPEDQPTRKRRATGSVASLVTRQGHGSEADDRPAEAETAAPKGRTNSAKARTVRALMPDDWTPSEELAGEARRQGVDLATEMAKMRDWANANARRMADWDAVARNWLRKAGEISSRASPRPPWKERQTGLGTALELVEQDRERARQRAADGGESVIDLDMWRVK